MLVLENVRFYPGEEKKNDPELSKAFADLADVYVNDAFGAAHRAHASTAGIAAYLPAVSGFLMQKELEVLGKAISNPDRPFTAIIGGAKVKDKIGVIESLLDKVDNLIIGGGLAYTFVKSTRPRSREISIRRRQSRFSEILYGPCKGKRRELPDSNRCSGSRRLFSNDANTSIVPISEIPSDLEALDIGTETREKYADVIKNSKLVVWNGPMGVFEIDAFAKGTKSYRRSTGRSKRYIFCHWRWRFSSSC
ncbi:hypothetical protein BsIDN1_59870 [Bacillus safensis]|uniref:Phosphoglycerate kinase n=1 Tax=Bacillus safensis TaxID=561879 RepID=A0A5S9MKH8_BACIA|nr:hypothetical protein BsIDN1_59870 [Bacillus safensis]